MRKKQIPKWANDTEQNKINYVDVEVALAARMCRFCGGTVRKGESHLHIHHYTEGRTQNHNICESCLRAVLLEIERNTLSESGD